MTFLGWVALLGHGGYDALAGLYHDSIQDSKNRFLKPIAICFVFFFSLDILYWVFSSANTKAFPQVLKMYLLYKLMDLRKLVSTVVFDWEAA